jgi:hypothetical protein
MALLNPSFFEYRDHSSVLPICREVMGEEDSFKDQKQEGYRSIWEMFQSPVRYTFRGRSLADPETTHGFLNLLRVGNLGSPAGAIK